MAQGLLSTPPSIASSSSLSKASASGNYVSSCNTLRVPVDAGVYACLKLGLSELCPSRPLTPVDIIAVCEAFPSAPHIKKIDFSRSQIGGAGCQLLADGLRHLPQLVSLKLQHCNLKALDLQPILEFIDRDDCGLQNVQLRGNAFGTSSPESNNTFALTLLSIVGREKASLVRLDISSCGLGEESVRKLEAAVGYERDGLLELDTEGNLFLLEFLNSLTHGLGFILALIGTYLLIARGAHISWRHALGVGVYGITLCLMYLSSTLYHCLFKFRLAKRFFKYLDHSAVFLLIAGTYTPILTISLHSRPMLAYPLLATVWAMCMLGLYMSIFGRKSKRFDFLANVLYLVMGWCCIIPGHAIVTSSVVPTAAIWLIFLGGVFYSIGVYFVASTRPVNHVIWHFLVLAASALHFFAVYLYILPKSSQQPQHSL